MSSKSNTTKQVRLHFAESLGSIAEILGKREDVDKWKNEKDAVVSALNDHLWDDTQIRVGQKLKRKRIKRVNTTSYQQRCCKKAVML